MCDLSQGFILCTCSPGGPTNWVLLREVVTPSTLEGMAALPAPLTNDEAQQVAYLQAGLDEPGCFDFDYTPQDGDVLTFDFGGRPLVFTFGRGGWHWGEDVFQSRRLLHQGEVFAAAADP